MRCAYASGRSYTEPTTNTVVLDGITLKRHAEDIRRGTLPNDTLPVFLHEASHHSCFLSPLGWAIALTELRARREVKKRLRRSSRGIGKTQRNQLVGSQIMHAILRPIAEGLACLEQFDYVPDMAGWYWTSAAKAVMPAACGAINKVLWDRYFRQALIDARLSERGVQQKADLLSHPFNCRSGGYLPGYVALKKLWQMAQHASRDFTDLGTYLNAVRYAVYHDHELTRLALSPEAPLVVIESTINRLKRLLSVPSLLEARSRQRYGQLAELLTAEHLFSLSRNVAPIDDYEAAGMAYASRLMFMNRGGDTEIEALIAAFNDLYDGSSTTTESTAIRKLLARRDWLWLGSERLNARRDGSWILALIGGDIRVIGTVSSASAPSGQFRARYDCFLSAWSGWLIRAISSENELVSFVAHAESEREAYERCRDLIFDRSQFMATELRLTRRITGALEASAPAALDEFRNRAADGMLALLASIAASEGAMEDTNLIAEASGAGFFDLLGQDVAAVRGLAFLGLCGAHDLTDIQVRELGGERAVDVDYVAPILHQTLQRLGFGISKVKDDNSRVLP